MLIVFIDIIHASIKAKYRAEYMVYETCHFEVHFLQRKETTNRPKKSYSKNHKSMLRDNALETNR